MATTPPLIGDWITGYCPVCGAKAKLDDSELMPWHTRMANQDALPRQCPGVKRQAVRVERKKPA